MRKSYEQRQATKLDTFVALLKADSEFFGLLGSGYPGSFYRVYVRPTKDADQPRPQWTLLVLGLALPSCTTLTAAGAKVRLVGGDSGQGDAGSVS